MNDEDILDDDGGEGGAVEAPAKKKKASPKKKAAPKAKAAKKEAGTTGRPPADDTLERRKKVIQLGKRKDGIANIDLAQALQVSTAQSQSICRPLIAVGQLKMTKDKATGRVVYKTIV